MVPNTCRTPCLAPSQFWLHLNSLLGGSPSCHQHQFPQTVMFSDTPYWHVLTTGNLLDGPVVGGRCAYCGLTKPICVGLLVSVSSAFLRQAPNNACKGNKCVVGSSQADDLHAWHVGSNCRLRAPVCYLSAFFTQISRLVRIGSNKT